MDQTDIKYVLDLINEAIASKDWDLIYDSREALKDFLDVDVPDDDE